MVIEKKIEAGQQKTRLAGLDNSLPTGAMDGPMSWATPLPVSLFLYEKKFFTSQFFFSLPLYSGDEVWEGIWNQTHLAVLNFCLGEITPRYHTSRYGTLIPLVS